MKLLSRVQLLATPWTAAYQAPPSMGFSKQEYWRGVPSPSPNNAIISSNTECMCISNFSIALWLCYFPLQDFNQGSHIACLFNFLS